MPTLLMEIPDTEAGIARPITLEIIRQVEEATGIKVETNILYPSEQGTEAQIGSRIGDDGESTKFGSTERVFVEVSEDYIPDRILTAAVYRPENLFVFNDPRLNTYIRPVYSSTEVSINFRYRAKNKVLARRWRDDIKNRSSMMRDVLIHDIDYHYIIPPELLYILTEIHRLRENQAGYGEDFESYLKKHATSRLTLLTNLSGSKDAWAIAESQGQIQGWFDFEGVPDQGDKENDTDAWTISFSYKFRYDKVLACKMAYPLMIHNQTLSSKYRDSKKPIDFDQKEHAYSLSRWQFAHFEKNPRNPPLAGSTGLGIPEVDDFIPSQVIPSTVRLLTALVKITPDDKRSLLNLSQLGKYQLNEVFMDFLLKSEAPYVTEPFQSIIQINAYRGTNIVPSRYIKLSNTGMVSCTEDLNLRDYHHVRIGLITDLTALSQDAVTRLRNNGCAFRTIMMAIAPWLSDMGLLPLEWCRNNYVTRDAFKKVLMEMDRVNLAKGNRQDYQFNTVMSLYVQAQRMEQA